MSGFGGLLAASVIAIMCTVALIFISNAIFLGISIYDSRIENMLALTALKAIPQIEHGVVTTSESMSTIRLNVTNVGFQGVKIRDVVSSDVIVIYFNGSMRKAIRLEYSDYKTSNSWRIERVFVGNKEGDSLNPINIRLKTGIWDPGETLELELLIQDFIDAGKGLSVVLALPGGVVSTAEF